MMIVEKVEKKEEELMVSGVQCKGMVQRRICVPPLNLPKRLWLYEGGNWKEVTDEVQLFTLMAGDVYEGYTLPENPVEGMVFFNLEDGNSIYNWQEKLQTGEAWIDIGVPKLRSKYKNFGWDTVIAPAETAMKHFVNNNLINPEEKKRKIPGLILEPDKGIGDALPWQARFDELDAVLYTIGEKTGMGFDVVADFTTKNFVFKTFLGEDLTQGIRKVVFSVRNGNASAVTYREDETGSATTAYIGGAGSDENRLILSVGGETEGLDRREVFVDGGSVDDIDMLKLQGENKLEEKKQTQTLTAQVLDSGICRYERDYNVGDKVLVADEEGRITASQILSVKETYELDRPRELEVTFGSSPVTFGKLFAGLRNTTIR